MAVWILLGLLFTINILIIKNALLHRLLFNGMYTLYFFLEVLLDQWFETLSQNRQREIHFEVVVTVVCFVKNYEIETILSFSMLDAQ